MQTSLLIFNNHVLHYFVVVYHAPYNILCELFPINLFPINNFVYVLYVLTKKTM